MTRTHNLSRFLTLSVRSRSSFRISIMKSEIWLTPSTNSKKNICRDEIQNIPLQYITYNILYDTTFTVNIVNQFQIKNEINRNDVMNCFIIVWL